MPEKRLPPGQYLSRELPVLHYGPVPRFRAETWDIRVFGATASGLERRWTWDGFCRLPARTVVADLHCVTRFSTPDNRWSGVPTSVLAEHAPPADEVTEVLVWAEFGYSANMRLVDFTAADTLLATHLDSERLSPEHGSPLRLVVPQLYAWKSVKWVRGVEYVIGQRRGFWEERGYHDVGDPWREQRYAYQDF